MYAHFDDYDLSMAVFGKPGYAVVFSEGTQSWSCKMPDGIDRSLSIQEVALLHEELRRRQIPDLLLLR